MGDSLVRASGGFSRQDMQDNYDLGYNAGVTATKVGDAQNGDVLYGKTYTNNSAVGATGSMPNRGAATIVTPRDGTNQTIAQGYHNGSGYAKVAAASGTRVLTSSETGSTDLGEYNSYRYVNAANVYNAGKAAVANATNFFYSAIEDFTGSDYETWRKVATINSVPSGIIVITAIGQHGNGSADACQPDFEVAYAGGTGGFPQIYGVYDDKYRPNSRHNYLLTRAFKLPAGSFDLWLRALGHTGLISISAVLIHG